MVVAASLLWDRFFRPRTTSTVPTASVTAPAAMATVDTVRAVSNDRASAWCSGRHFRSGHLASKSVSSDRTFAPVTDPTITPVKPTPATIQPLFHKAGDQGAVLGRSPAGRRSLKVTRVLSPRVSRTTLRASRLPLFAVTV